MDHHPCLVDISLLKIANLSLYVSRLPLMITGSYFIILGLELQGVKAVCVDTASRAVLPTSPRTQNQSPCQTEGAQFSGWVKSLGVVKCLGNSLRLLMQFEVAVCVLAYSVFWKEKNPTRFFKDIWPVPTRILPEYGGRAFLQYMHCPCRRPCDSKFSTGPVYKAGPVFIGFPERLSFTSLELLHKDSFVRQHWTLLKI